MRVGLVTTRPGAATLAFGPRGRLLTSTFEPISKMGVLVIGTVTLNGAALRRVFALVLAVFVLMSPVALPSAHAEPDYPPSFYKISASTFTARVGQSIDFKAQTFQDGAVVSFDVAADGGSVTSGTTNADARGIARQSITFTVVGDNTLTMSGTSDQGRPLTLRASIAVTADEPGGSGGNGDGNDAGGDNGSGDPAADESGVPFLGGGLPRTGGDIALTVLIGAGLLAAGAALVFAARRRTTS